MGWQATITNTGIQMLNNLTAESTLTLSRVGTATGVAANIQTATSLTYPVTLTASEWGLTKQGETDGVRIRVRIFAHSGAYTMRQIGVFGRIDNGNEQLFILIQYNPDPDDVTGITIPSSETFPDFAYNISFFVSTSLSDSFAVAVNTSSLVSQGQLNAAMANVVNLYREYYSADSSVSCPLAANRTFLIWTAGSGAETIIGDSTSSLFLASNGKYGAIYKGSGISETVSNGRLVVSTTGAESVPMAVIEL